MEHAAWMQRCLQLAANGAGLVAPNPLVGAVLVQGERILAEGWHRAHGGPHAEVECLRAFGDGEIPADAVMYVSLEPCSHTGLTPPCADLLIARDIRTVVVGCSDPDPRVAGKGIAKLRDAGISVLTDVLREECRWQNRRFITSVEEQRPYIILKWARSSDGFLDQHPRAGRTVQRISCFSSDVLVHRWRSEEQAIMVGSRTVLNDDPRLDVRHVAGRSPLRVILDRNGLAPATSHVFDGSIPTLLFTKALRSDVDIEQVILKSDEDPLPAVLAALNRRKVRSILVEGGAELLGHFLRNNLWDEAREVVGEALFLKGTPAPRMGVHPQRSITSGSDRIHLYSRLPQPDSAWSL
ncbi:MAG: bifunctional diaminohydroxyphosphoribosylaminopyrimidine deaminase/5-amino-6-(5-phosphoribosylamino)uracil reductase RibD [Flavobacteriales bacterium]